MLDFFQLASVAGKDDFGKRKRAENTRLVPKKTLLTLAGMPQCCCHHPALVSPFCRTMVRLPWFDRRGLIDPS
jgi:hypothetical protein